MCRLRCKSGEDKGSHEDGSRVDRKDEVIINGAEVVEDGVAPIDPSSTSIFKVGDLSEDSGEGSTTALTGSCGTPTSS